jgi:phosphoglycerate dehydrogenase-like enzyme
MPVTLVVCPAVEEERLAALKALSPELVVFNAATEADALAAMPSADAFFGKITPSLLAAATRLRWVQSPTASLEHYIFPELIAHPCVLTNMRGLFNDVIADHVLAYVLYFARNLQHYVLHQLARHWEPMGGEKARVAFSTGPGVINDIDRAHLHLADCTLGIVGMGNIGREVARRARAFSMRVLGVDVQPRPCPDAEAVWPLERLPELLRASHFVVVTVPHTPQSVKMFRKPQFEMMREDGWFINVGRGATVDLDDLTEAIREDRIAGAALDVFEKEPLPENHPLWDMVDRVLITPHVAGYSPRIAERHRAVLLDNVQRFLTGQPLRNIVDKTRWF